MIDTRYLAADRRKNNRAQGALRVEIGSTRLAVVDWSAGGVRIAGAPSLLALGAEFTLRLSVAIEGVSTTMEASAGVVRLDPARREAALAFAPLPPVGVELLNGVAQAIEDAEPTRLPELSGSVDPAVAHRPLASVGSAGATSTETRPHPLPGGDPSSTPWRPPGRTVLYLVVALLFAAYIATSVYRRVWRIEVDTAALVAPTARLVSPVNGILQTLDVAPGDHVAKGDRLFVLNAPAEQKALEQAQAESTRAESRVVELEAARSAQASRLAIHREVLRTRIAARSAGASLLGEQVGLVQSRVARLQALVLEQATSQFEVDAAREQLANVAAQLEEVRALLSVEKTRLRAAAEGFYMDGERMPEGLPEIVAALASARTERDLARVELDAQRIRAELSQVGRAPFTARVSAVVQTAGTPLREGNLIVVLEHAEDLLVEAWLTRDQAEYVRLGDVARISVAAVGREYDGVVLSLDTDLAAATQAVADGHTPRLKVLLDVGGYAGEPDSRAGALDELHKVNAAGLPAVVSFGRSWR